MTLKLVTKILMLASIAAIGVTSMTTDADARRYRKKNKTDFALFDATNPANTEPGVVCGLRNLNWRKPWNFHVAVTNNSPTDTHSFQVIYKDGDWVRYYVPPQSSFALTQSAGNNAAGAAIRVFAKSSQLSGVVSAQSLTGVGVACKSCDNDSDGPAACDAIIPFN